MHIVTTKSECHIFHVVQSLTKAKHLALLLKGPETQGFLRTPHPPLSPTPKPQILSVDYTQKVRVKHFWGTGVKEAFSALFAQAT